MFYILFYFFFFFFNDTATTEIYTLSLHDALPICAGGKARQARRLGRDQGTHRRPALDRDASACECGRGRSEEHTSELQSRLHLVCRLLLEKKKKNNHKRYSNIIYATYSIGTSMRS